jgi:hypothetical protein
VPLTHERTDRFKIDYAKLTTAEQDRFRATVIERFIPAIETGEYPAGLKIKGVQGAPGVFEMSWAPDGRATFEFGEERLPGQRHIVWRRIGGHEVFGSP